MRNRINLLYDDGKQPDSDIEKVKAFYEFLKGDTQKLSKRQAFSIIYYLQEHLPLFPDNIEKCENCGEEQHGNPPCEMCGYDKMKPTK